MDSGGTKTYLRDGAGVTAPVLNDAAASYTPGISERRSSATTYYHGGIKNAESQTNTSQSVTATQTFDAFGNADTSSGTWKGPFAYGGPFGYQSDSDSGLMLLGHRYYDSSTGRFLTRDPAKNGRNCFGYCHNNPLTFADPFGFDEWWNHLGDGEVWTNGLTTSLVGAGMALSNMGVGLVKSIPISWAFGAGGLHGWDGGDHKDDPGLGESAFLWEIGFSLLPFVKGRFFPPKPPGAGVGAGSGGSGESGGLGGLIDDLNTIKMVKGRKLPREGAPGGTSALFNEKGALKTVRVYDESGNAAVDIDWGHGHHGSGSPHYHVWKDGIRGGGNRFQN